MSEQKKTSVDEAYEKLYEEAESQTAKKQTKPESTMKEILDGMDSSRTRKKDGNELLRFFCGLLLFGAGMFMIFQNLTVTSNMGYGGSIFRIGGFNLPNGTIMIPLLIGIALTLVTLFILRATVGKTEQAEA